MPRSHGVSPMSTSSTSPASSAAGPTASAGLSAPKATVTSARTARGRPASVSGTWPVSTSTPLGTSTATTVARLPSLPEVPGQARGELLGRVPQPARAADAHDAVDHQVGSGGRPVDDAPAGGTQSGQTLRVRPTGAQQQRGHRHAPAGQVRAREERVAAVVAGADQQQHPGAVDPAPVTEQQRAAAGQPCRGPAASTPGREGGHQARFRRANVRDAPYRSHATPSRSSRRRGRFSFRPRLSRSRPHPTGGTSPGPAGGSALWRTPAVVHRGPRRDRRAA